MTPRVPPLRWLVFWAWRTITWPVRWLWASWQEDETDDDRAERGIW